MHHHHHHHHEVVLITLLTEYILTGLQLWQNRSLDKVTLRYSLSVLLEIVLFAFRFKELSKHCFNVTIDHFIFVIALLI